MIDKLAFIEIQDKKVLVARTRGRDIYYLPGGKRETGESDEQALTREIEEELTIKIDPASVEFYGTFLAQAHGQPQGVMVNMRCYAGLYSGEIAASAEIEEVAWLSYADREKVSEVDKIIFDDLKARELLD